VETLALAPEETSRSRLENLPWLIALVMVAAMTVATEVCGAEIAVRWQFGYYLAAYFLAAGSVLKVVVHRLRHRGEFFNEFTLMTIATLGAFYLGKFSEGVSVMVFYRIGEAFQARAVNRAKRSIRALLAERGVSRNTEAGGADEAVPEHLLQLIEEAAQRKSRLQEFLTKFARVYTPTVVGIALLVIFLPYLWSHPYVFNEHFYNGLGVLIIACPCALVVSIPLGYFGGLGLAGRYGVLYKGAIHLDAAAKVDTVVFDKTGTLTLPGSDGTDSLKPEAPRAVAQLKAHGLRTILVSGGTNADASAIAELCRMDEFHGAASPEEKVELVRKLRKTGHVVAFVGDGSNDAPAMAQADLGLVMGMAGSNRALDAADAVIQDDRPDKVLLALEAGRRTRAVVWQNILLAFAIKVLVLILLSLGMSELWEAVFADVGVTLLAIMNAVRLQRQNSGKVFHE